MYPRGYISVATEIRKTDVRPVGEGVSEMRIDYGPGYRVYFTTRARLVIILLAGGDKSTQAKDIGDALHLARNL
jgi:putative addiction module killer protein